MHVNPRYINFPQRYILFLVPLVLPHWSSMLGAPCLVYPAEIPLTVKKVNKTYFFPFTPFSDLLFFLLLIEVMLNVCGCQQTYEGQTETNAEAWFNKSLRPRKPEGSLGQTAQNGHLDSHTAPELCCFSLIPLFYSLDCFLVPVQCFSYSFP